MKKDERTDISERALPPRIELCSNTFCCVEGIKKILDCSEKCIKFNLGKRNAVFCGDSLYIRSFSSDGAVIEGIIVSLEFEDDD